MGTMTAVRSSQLSLALWLVAVGAATGCSPAPTRPEPASEQSTFADWWPEQRAALTEGMPGPAPSRPRGFDAVAENRACASCHPAIFDEWHGSLHQRSTLDPMYRRALAMEPLSFCRACHAPEAEPSAPAPADLGALGVGCVSCHVVEGRLLAPEGGPDDPTAPHPVQRERRFGGSGACAGCHEFSFPDRRPRSRGDLMQSTVQEHAASVASDTSCASCHMPRVDGHRSHAFRRDPKRLKDALRIETARSDEAIEVTLATRGVGHALPTGDLFRRIAVAVEWVGPDGDVVHRDARYATRHFTRDRLRRRVLVRDDRPPGSGEPVTLRLDVPPEARRHAALLRIEYQRVLHPPPEDDAPAEVHDRTLIDRRRIPAEALVSAP